MATQRAKAVVSFMLAIVASGTLTTPAYAGGVILDSTCYPDWVCMWEDSGYYGDRWVNFYAQPQSSLPFNREIGGWNGDNEISSVKNKTPNYVCIYADDAQQGDWIRLSPGENVYSLADSYDFNDDAESFRVTNGSC